MMRVPELKLFSAKHGLVMTSVRGHLSAPLRHFHRLVRTMHVLLCYSVPPSSSNSSLGPGRCDSDSSTSLQIHDLILYRQEIGK